MNAPDLALQAAYAVGYYVALLLLVRIAGKRMAGQTTTFDLIVLIALAVVAQEIALSPGTPNALVFLVVVLLTHRCTAALCARSPAVRHFLRGKPRALVVDGEPILTALRDEGVTTDELMAGLRKLGYERTADVKLAVLEETGHISAVAKEPR